MNIAVSRSPLRLLVYALLAVPAVLLAVDMTISYRWIDPPEKTDVVVGQTTDESGELVDITKDVLTDTGRSQRRRDLLFGAGLFVGGAAAIGWALKELARPTRFLIADDEGLLVRVDGLRQPPRRFGWSDIAEVRSGIVEDDGIDAPVLSIRLVDVEQVPHLPAGGYSEPPWLHLYSDEWDQPAYQVAALLEHKMVGRASTGELE
ncbi:MAG: hypothetical protein V3S62_00985 [Acidimicrobiia bacterium]